jgi:hypothetical protein
MLEFLAFNFNIYLCNFVQIFRNVENLKNAEFSYYFVLLEMYRNYYIWNRTPAKMKRNKTMKLFNAPLTGALSTRNADICA